MSFLWSISMISNFSGLMLYLARTCVKFGQRFQEITLCIYKSAKGSNWVSQGGESESGQMALKKVKWAYFDAYLCQTMWNHAKKSMKEVKRPNSLFLQGEVSSAVLKTWKTGETKTWITQNFQILYHIQGTTIEKLTSWGFRKCGSFCPGEFLKRSYWLSKYSHFPFFLKAKCGVQKKRHGHNFDF